MAEQTILFCPFCRESFEGERVCPEHDIALVPFDKLPPSAEGWDDDEPPPVFDERAPLSPFEWRYGRGLVFAGALLDVAALALEFLRGLSGARGVRTFELARTLPSLWTLSLVAITLVVILQRRRSPVALRGMRVLVPALAFVSPLAVAWAFYRLHHGAAVWVSEGSRVGLELGPAPYVVALSALCVLVGGLRLGVAPAATSRA